MTTGLPLLRLPGQTREDAKRERDAVYQRDYRARLKPPERPARGLLDYARVRGPMEGV